MAPILRFDGKTPCIGFFHGSAEETPGILARTIRQHGYRYLGESHVVAPSAPASDAMEHWRSTLASAQKAGAVIYVGTAELSHEQRTLAHMAGVRIISEPRLVSTTVFQEPDMSTIRSAAAAKAEMQRRAGQPVDKVVTPHGPVRTDTWSANARRDAARRGIPKDVPRVVVEPPLRAPLPAAPSYQAPAPQRPTRADPRPITPPTRKAEQSPADGWRYDVPETPRLIPSYTTPISAEVRRQAAADLDRMDAARQERAGLQQALRTGTARSALQAREVMRSRAHGRGGL